MNKSLFHTCIQYTILITGTIWLIGFLLFVVGTIVVKYHPLEKSNAIIVLTGGKDHRVQSGIDLLSEKWADKMFISGVNKMVTGQDILQNTDTELLGAIQLGYQAENTHTNAIEVCQWILKNKIQSVILVTSFYHMPRSLLEIENVCPNIMITPHSIYPQEFDESTSWLHKRYTAHLFMEYHKFLATFVQQRIQGIKNAND